MRILRHGDLNFTQVTSVPKNAKLINDSSEFILAYGEATGHHHKMKSKKGFKVFELEGKKYIEIPFKAVLTHQEHDTIEFDKGIYEMDFEREYDYFLESIQQVID